MLTLSQQLEALNQEEPRLPQTFAALLEACERAHGEPNPTPPDYGIPVTWASMISTDGFSTVIGIYRGVLLGPKGRRYVDYNDPATVHFATVNTDAFEYRATVARLAREYQTAVYPAIDWSA